MWKGNWTLHWSCLICVRPNSSSSLLQEPQISQPWPMNSNNWLLWWLKNSPTKLLQNQGLSGTSKMKWCCTSWIEYLFLSSITMFTQHCLEIDEKSRSKTICIYMLQFQYITILLLMKDPVIPSIFAVLFCCSRFAWCTLLGSCQHKYNWIYK